LNDYDKDYNFIDIIDVVQDPLDVKWPLFDDFNHENLNIKKYIFNPPG